jgi:hypothetical protein
VRSLRCLVTHPWRRPRAQLLAAFVSAVNYGRVDVTVRCNHCSEVLAHVEALVSFRTYGLDVLPQSMSTLDLVSWWLRGKLEGD